jgi:nucleotide-binding universal stress UspA family protein
MSWPRADFPQRLRAQRPPWQFLRAFRSPRAAWRGPILAIFCGMDRDSVRRRISNVVLGTDFQRHSHDAIARAAWLPIAPGGRVTLVHAMPLTLPHTLEQRVHGECTALMRGAEETLAAERARADGPPLETEVVIEPGRAPELLDRVVKEGFAELVVVGRGERHGANERLLGSNAERVARLCDSTVLVVGRAPKARYRRPLVAADFSAMSERALEWALRVAQPAGGVDVVHAFDAPWVPLLRETGWTPNDLDAYLDETEARAQDQLADWSARLPDVGVEVRCHLRVGDPRRIIRQEAEEIGADLIVMGTHGRAGITRLLIGSVAESLVRTAACDVLVVR